MKLTFNDVVAHALKIQSEINSTQTDPIHGQYASLYATSILESVSLTVGDIIHGQKQAPQITYYYYVHPVTGKITCSSNVHG